MTRRALPGDLGINVIDHLHVDTESISVPHNEAHYLRILSACCLVCKEWLYHAQRTLFHILYTRNHLYLESILQTFETKPHLRNFVHGVHIEMHPEKSAGQSLRDAVAILLARHVPNIIAWHYGDRLQPFMFEHRYPKLSLDRRARECLRVCFTVQTLSLRNISFDRPVDFIRLLLAFPNLTSLECIGDFRLSGGNHPPEDGFQHNPAFAMAKTRLQDNIHLREITVSELYIMRHVGSGWSDNIC